MLTLRRFVQHHDAQVVVETIDDHVRVGPPRSRAHTLCKEKVAEAVPCTSEDATVRTSFVHDPTEEFLGFRPLTEGRRTASLTEDRFGYHQRCDTRCVLHPPIRFARLEEFALFL